MSKNPCSLVESQEYVISNLTLEDLFARIPGHIYAKDRNGVYVAGNNYNMQEGLPSKNFLGKTDYDLPWKDKADHIRHNDKEVMQIEKAKVYIEQGKLQDGRYATAISFKAPLRDESHNVIGIIGNTIELTEELTESLLDLLTSNEKSKSKKK